MYNVASSSSSFSSIEVTSDSTNASVNAADFDNKQLPGKKNVGFALVERIDPGSYRGLRKKFPEFTIINHHETPSKQNLNPKFVLNQTLLLLYQSLS